jgi:hypothetical protein
MYLNEKIDPDFEMSNDHPTKNNAEMELFVQNNRIMFNHDAQESQKFGIVQLLRCMLK